MKKQLKKGFTLTELVIVIVIIAILAAVLIPSMTGYVNRAKKSSCEQTAQSIGTVFAAWLVDESDIYSYASNSSIYMSEKACNKYNATLSNAVKAGDVETAAKNYQANDVIYIAPITSEITFKTASETGYTVAYTVTAADTWVLTQSKDGSTNYTAGDTIYIAPITSEITFKTASETGYTVAYKVTAADTWVLTQVKTPATLYTETSANSHNDTLTGAKSATSCSFNVYYLEAYENNTEVAEDISNVSVTGFTYNNGKYKTVATYSNGAFTYETTEAK